MKRFGQIEIITAVIIIVTSLAGPAGAEILWSGNVDPSDPSTWDSSVYAYIGKYGNGTMSITGGSDVIDYRGTIGTNLSSTGVVTVDGAGSTWTNSSALWVGYQGSGTMNITNGGTVSARYESAIGYRSSTGEVTVDGVGSTWTNGNVLRVGYGYNSNGTLNITNGGEVSNKSIQIGDKSLSTATVTVDGAGSKLINSVDIYVGIKGDGTLNITNGGEVSSYYPSVMGNFSGSTGEVTVDGAGSTWTNSNNLRVGYSGNGTLNITNGGLVSVGGGLTIDYDDDGDSFVNMATGGMLALFGEADDSLVDFMGLIAGTDAIRYWDESIAGWADITGATKAKDYTLEYLTEGNLAGYTMLTVPGSVIPINVDIKPGSCPNPLRVNFIGGGILPVAILGTEDFDVLDIDVATIALEGVSPIRSNYADVSSSSDGEGCECTTLGPDGFLDLELKFDRSSLLTALEESVGDLSVIGHRTQLPLTLTVMLMDEDIILEGTDCVRILNRGRVKRKK